MDKKNYLSNTENSTEFIGEISQLISSSKQRMAVAVNAELTLLYWYIGQRINQYLLQGERAKYGEDIIPKLSQHLTEQFGKGWSKRHLGYLMQFAATFPDVEILHTLCAKLSWSRFIKLFIF